MTERTRYFYDCLYGAISMPPIVWNVLTCPELQRLREIRLCNINSLCLTGASNINRFEHAIGTCYLALQCYAAWPLMNPISDEEYVTLVLASLLHDVVSAPFGHSVEYIESRKGFQHDQALSFSLEKGSDYEYLRATYEQIYFKVPHQLTSRVGDRSLLSIDQTIAGRGRFGPLVNSRNGIDLDNIDNVFRLAYHLGIISATDTPLNLARSLWIENQDLVVRQNAIDLLLQWQLVRKRLYRLLLLNPDEFSAKCMLSDALEEAKEHEEYAFRWDDVDYQLVTKLSEVSHTTEQLMSRLMTGDLYTCIGIFSSKRLDKYDWLNVRKNRKQLEKELEGLLRGKYSHGNKSSSRFKSAMVGIHLILDNNKTERQIHILTDNGEELTLGNSSKELLIGIFLKNENMSSTRFKAAGELRGLRTLISNRLSEILEDNNLREVELYGEIETI